MPLFSAMVKASKLMWIKRMTDERYCSWKETVKYLLKCDDIHTFLSYKLSIKLYKNPDLLLFYKQILATWYEVYCVLPQNSIDICR